MGTQPPSSNQRFVTSAWLCFFLVLAFVFAGARPLWEPDEGRYAETGRELLASGDWLVPRLPGEPHLTKPPLTYWAIASGLAILGVNEWGARIFLSLAFFITILATIGLAKAWGWRREQALAAGLIFSTAALPYACGHILTTDMFLTCWETLGVLCAWKVWSAAPRVGLWRLGFWLAFGLAFLTKGPPGWMPLLVVGLFAWKGRRRQPQTGLLSPLGLALFLLVSLSWYLALVAQDPARFRYFIIDEVYARIFTGEHEREKPFYVYIYTVFLGLTPWLFLWPALIGRAWQRLMRGWSPGKSPSRAFRPLTASAWEHLREGWRSLDDIKRFSVLWFLVPYLIFTLSRSRMVLYVVPLFVPIAIWGGKILVETWPEFRPRTKRGRVWAYPTAAVWLLVMLGVVVYPEWGPKSRSRRGLARELLALPKPPDRLASYGNPPHSLSFYTGMMIEELDLKPKNIIPYLHSELRKGETVALVTRETRLAKLPRFGWRVLAEDGDRAVIVATEIESSRNSRAP